MSPREWHPVYEAGVPELTQASWLRATSANGHLMTHYLEFNLYGIAQKAALCDMPITPPMVLRMDRCIDKVFRHLSLLGRETDNGDGQSPSLPEVRETERVVRERLRALTRSPDDALDVLAETTKKVILCVTRVHRQAYNLDEGTASVAHHSGPTWLSGALERVLEEGDRRLGKYHRVVAFRPPFRVHHHKTLLLVIDEETPDEVIREWMYLVRRHYRELEKANVTVNFTSPTLLTSQYYGLWSSMALGSYLLEVAEVFDPCGSLRVKHPPESRTTWKIWCSSTQFEELHLPIVTFPHRFPSLYAVPEIEMLFHYQYYLRDRERYLDLAREAKGEPGPVIREALSRFASETDLTWPEFPNGNGRIVHFSEAYPYIKRLADIVNELARQRTDTLAA